MFKCENQCDAVLLDGQTDEKGEKRYRETDRQTDR